ncbi:hypothetical protein BDD12DRAFT_225673 [Trichophaea hybrida]|nr:hypothetical protein BDD12DRAFT_225673 [Trichophaea hybrida]
MPGNLEKGFIVGGRAGDERGGMLVTGGVMDVREWMAERDEIEKTVDAEGFVKWVKSCVHSDANLKLVPKLVKKACGKYGGQVKATVVGRVIRYTAPNVIDKIWELENVAWSGCPSTNYDDDDLANSWGPWTDDSTWEFRSAGDYLVICDDNSGQRVSTVTCFASGTCTTPLWQRKMEGQDKDIQGQPRAFFYDNDGIRMNSAFIAYASRLKRSTISPSSEYRSIMEFLLLSTQTGVILRVLNIPKEDRPQQILGLCAWCSFSVSESLLVATVGGRNSNPQPGVKYQYPKVFIWDLAAPSRSSSPTHVINLPQTWKLSHESFTALSADGRWLGVQVDWDMGAWDLETRTCVGVWCLAGAERYNNEEPWDASERVSSSNSLWVKYRDIYETPPPDSSTAISTTPESEQPATELAGKEIHHVACFTSRILRRIFDRNIATINLGHEHNEYPESIFSEPEDDNIEDDDDDDDDDDEDMMLSDIDYDDDYEDDYENDDEDFDTEGEDLILSLAGLADPEWVDTDESDSGDDASDVVGADTGTAGAPWADGWGGATLASPLPWEEPQLSNAPSVSDQHNPVLDWHEPQPSDALSVPDDRISVLAWDEPQPSDVPPDEHTREEEMEETMYYDYNCAVESEYDEDGDYDDYDGFY